MRAAVVERYGPPEVVAVRDVPTPEPRKGQVLVRVRSAAVTSGDARIRAARFPPGFAPFARSALGLRRPRRPILGGSFAGEVHSVGPGVDGFEPGTRVCGMSGVRMGAHAEYVVIAATRLARVPATVGDDEAAGVLFGGTTALRFLQKAQIGSDATVLVNGASGAVGTNAVQIAAQLGATVTGVTSGANAPLVTELGAAVVIDHTRHDVTDTSERFDVVFDAVGNLSIASGRRLLRERGVLLLAVAGLLETVRARGAVVAGPIPERTEDVEHLLGLVESGALKVVVERAHDLDDIVSAHRHVDGGHKIGNVVVHP